LRKRVDGGLSLTTLEKMLNAARTLKSYERFRMSTTPIYKPSFFKYLNWCVDKGMLDRTLVGINPKQGVVYLTTEKGRQFLELIQ